MLKNNINKKLMLMIHMLEEKLMHLLWIEINKAQNEINMLFVLIFIYNLTIYYRFMIYTLYMIIKCDKIILQLL